MLFIGISNQISNAQTVSGFLPSDLGNLKAWYDTSSDDYLTLVGSAITQFLDRSGSGNHTNVQSTGTARPTRELNQLNGLQAATFDGGDFLTLPSALYGLSEGDNTIFFVSKQDTAGVQDRLYSATASGSTKALVAYSNNVEAFYYNNGSFDNVETSGAINTQFGVITSFRDGTTQSISYAGSTATTDTAGADIGGIDAIAIGATAAGIDPLNGAIAEVLIFDRALTASEILQVELYLSEKWGVYHPQAPWLGSFSVDEQALINAALLNKDEDIIQLASLIEAWYDSTNERYLTTVSTAITQFLDKSGKENDTGVQGTSTARPTFTASQQNGLSGAVFDGGDYLDLPSALYNIPNNDNTVFIVSKRQTENANGMYAFSMSEGGSARYHLRYEGAAGISGFLSSNSSSGTVTNSGNTNTDYNIQTAFKEGTTQGLSFNGDTASTNANGANEDGIDAARIGQFTGGSVSLTGGILELIVCNSKLTTENINIVNQLLSTKYNITLS